MLMCFFPRLLTQVKVTPCFACALCGKLQSRPDDRLVYHLVDHLYQCHSLLLVGLVADHAFFGVC
jgi:hypothetical protein